MMSATKGNLRLMLETMSLEVSRKMGLVQGHGHIDSLMFSFIPLVSPLNLTLQLKYLLDASQ